ncbi:aromatase/cyclase [Kitasatospora sp. NPDC089509]|uniref:aromatase/cyclase n=1 Tax=Kitasatospora sp. NPDC089509 TaxID=3364079 RepID=UPI0038092350
MPESATTHRTKHSIVVNAPVDTVYGLIADVEQWPTVFPPTMHSEVVERGEGTERIRLWALANGEVKTWTSRRTLDPVGRSVRFRQEVSQPPVRSMGGAWELSPQSDRRTLVVLLHDFQALGDDPEGVRVIERAVDHNSRVELERLRNVAELPGEQGELTVSFADTVRIRGRAGDVYRFLYQADRWPDRLPHVARLVLREDAPGIQEMEMDTRSADSETHTTSSVRVCFPEHRIVYKQTVLPAVMTVHTGEWSVEQQGDSVLATSRHTVVLDPEGVAKALGPAVSIAEAKELAKTALSKNSRTTLEHARRFAEEAQHGEARHG